MAARPAASAPNAEQFEAYFQRADLNKDGKISGEEAVAFFQGSNLPKNVLAQIWMHSDKNNSGFLGRPEFYNALRLVTVAQSGRELTREIVKAALEGPAAAKIPPPQINTASMTTPPVNPMFAPKAQMNITLLSSSQMTLPPTAAQNLGFRGPNISMNNQPFPSLTNQLVRSPSLQSTPASSSVTMEPLSQGLSRGGVPRPQLSSSSTPNLTTDWFDVRTNVKSGVSQISNKEAPSSMAHDGFPQTHSGPTSLSTQQSQVAPVANSMLSQSLNLSGTLSSQSDSKALAISGNGFLSDSTFGGDAFTATQPNQGASSFTFPTTKMANSSSSGFLSSGSLLQDKPVNKVEASKSFSSMVMGGNPLEQNQSLVKHSQLDVIPKTTTPASSAGSGAMGAVSSSLPQSEVSQVPWPKMTPSNIQKYTKVFVEVDKDRDGKITGEEARNLFLSWRLPREVLKQVWDLSDQDGDSMLSLREFCLALYLMERYREGRPLPAILPNSLRFDDALLQATSQPSMPYGNVAWQSNTGFAHQALPVSHPVMPAPVVRPQQKIQMQPTQQKSAVPALDKHLVNQFSNEEQNSLNSKLKDAVDADEKVQESEKEIMDSKEKIEFYRTKMQDLVLYKSRCDNRLNEITEKASSDKREVEGLAKKYEEKYKQVADVASKLTVEEATFREIQERKQELYNAIVKMEQGGSADGLLQVRADRIQYDLEELVKSLNDRCKKHGLRTKLTAFLELPFGWQPGVPEGAADWDEDWDKFEDDGFMLVKELTADVGNVKAPSRDKASHASSDKASEDGTMLASTSDAEKVEKYSNTDDHEIKSDLADLSVRSPPSSLPVKNSFESPSKGSHPTEFGLHDATFHPTDNHSDHGAAESISGDIKFADETPWGATFDSNDDDSIWGFNTFDKDTDHQSMQNSFDAGHFGLNPIRTSSPSASSVFGKTRSPFFDESVPATPFSSGPSPRYGDGVDNSFGSFGRFDSFSSQDQKNIAKFDSMSSSRDFDSSGLFFQPETLATFDSVRNSRERDRSRGFMSFDDSDPFATGSFKSSESNATTPKRASDNWSAF